MMHRAVGRRRLLLGGTVAFGAAVTARSAAAQNEYAVFTEFSPADKLMAPGWNRRIFTDTDSRRGDGIKCDFATGVVSLAPGSYHLSGMSMVSYAASGEPEMTTIRAPAAAGYCRLRVFDPLAVVDTTNLHAIDNGDRSIICIGSVSTPNLAPSVFDGYYETDRTAQIVLEHQSGKTPKQIYLRVFTENSKWHAFARINVRKI
jgi:hypothetical protein